MERQICWKEMARRRSANRIILCHQSIRTLGFSVQVRRAFRRGQVVDLVTSDTQSNIEN